MTFTPGEPQNGESLGSSKPKIRSNLDGLRASLAVNHVDINAGTDNGKHKFIQMPEQGSDATTGAAIGALYTKGTAGFANLYWRQETGGANAYKDQGAVVNMTGPAPAYTVFSGTERGGYTFLPGGLLLQYGEILGAIDGTDFIWPSQQIAGIPFTTFVGMQLTMYQLLSAAPVIVEYNNPTGPNTLLTRFKFIAKTPANASTNASASYVAIGFY